jgi:hypothetical protein
MFRVPVSVAGLSVAVQATNVSPALALPTVHGEIIVLAFAVEMNDRQAATLKMVNDFTFLMF